MMCRDLPDIIPNYTRIKAKANAVETPIGTIKRRLGCCDGARWTERRIQACPRMKTPPNDCAVDKNIVIVVTFFSRYVDASHDVLFVLHY
jgi:hypothetical protein